MTGTITNATRRLLCLAAVTAALLSSQGTEVITARYRTSAAPATTFTAVQHLNTGTCNGGAPAICTLTVSTMCASTPCIGIIYASNNGNGSQYITSVSGGGGTWISNGLCPSTDNHGDQYQGEWVDMAYNLSLTSGSSVAITINWSGNYGNGNFGYAEYTYTGSAPTFGGCVTLGTTSSGPYVSPSVTTTGSSSLIVTIEADNGRFISGNTVSGTGWTSPTTPITLNSGYQPGDDALNVAAGTYQVTYYYDGDFPVYWGGSALWFK